MDNQIFDNIKSITFCTENFEDLTVSKDDITYTEIHYYDDEDRYVGEIEMYPCQHPREFLHLTIKLKSNTKCHWKQYAEEDDFDAIARFEKFRDIDLVTITYLDGKENNLQVHWSYENPELSRLDHDLYQKHYYEVKDGNLTGNYCLELVIKEIKDDNNIQ